MGIDNKVIYHAATENFVEFEEIIRTELTDKINREKEFFKTQYGNNIFGENENMDDDIEEV